VRTSKRADNEFRTATATDRVDGLLVGLLHIQRLRPDGPVGRSPRRHCRRSGVLKRSGIACKARDFPMQCPVLDLEPRVLGPELRDIGGESAREVLKALVEELSHLHAPDTMSAR
jgi:hypothetical protein